jgi:phosphoglycolate phosphatase-like HAD superfamily hydrolase
MRPHRIQRGVVELLLCLAVWGRTAAAQTDPLPSWKDGPAKQAILKFVADTTTPGAADFVPPPERIATFDNDGTLWAEQPMYTQLAFLFDRIKAQAPQHPEWKTEEPYRSVLAGQYKQALACGEKCLDKLMAATHAGMTTEQFHQSVRDWIATAKNPVKNRLYTEMVYQPMLELLAYMRASGFKTYIVSGGGVDFMRPWTQKTYGIPPEQVVGTTGQLKYEFQNGKPVLMKLPEVALIDDGPGKPVGIERFIGRRPVFAFGNSDGDQQMLEWTWAGGGKRFAGIVHHTDAEREWKYDHPSSIGQLDKALVEAKQKGWIVVDMKTDWKIIFPQAN